VEEIIAPTSSSASPSTRTRPKSTGTAQPRSAILLQAVSDYPQARLSTDYAELDRVLGGGIVPGSLTLLGGDPGIGKSTLLLQVAQQLADRYPILYVCAEESGQQVKMRWQRLENPKESPDSLDATSKVPASQVPTAPDSKLYLLPEIELETILLELESLRPQLAVIDSIQAIYDAALNSAPGSVSQVRECTATLMRVAKRMEIALLLVGHVTKEGAIAGPKVLEHLVDTVLYFEGDRFASHRLLRSVKNRFGATHELGVFEMRDRGLVEVANPSSLFLGNQEESVPGTCTIVACEGTRPLLVELQALVSPTSYPSPRRTATGFEFNRLVQILAVLEKRVGLPLSKFDAYVASAGGLNVGEPAADLGVALAIAASFRDRIVQPHTVLIGEVGLGGQVRSVSQMELRLKEAAKLGFKQAIVPKGQETQSIPNLQVIPVARVIDAITLALRSTEASS
jgi:DNA repair protein RadA/Sms